MGYNIIVSENASQDLIDIYGYIYHSGSPDSAEYVLEQLEKTINSLAHSPQRGSYPQELLVTGIKEYREIYFKPYRIIYDVDGNDVNILIVADGRRDMRKILALRVLL